MKNKKYHTEGAVPKSNRKIEERDKINTPKNDNEEINTPKNNNEEMIYLHKMK